MSGNQRDSTDWQLQSLLIDLSKDPQAATKVVSILFSYVEDLQKSNREVRDQVVEMKGKVDEMEMIIKGSDRLDVVGMQRQFAALRHDLQEMARQDRVSRFITWAGLAVFIGLQLLGVV